MLVKYTKLTGKILFTALFLSLSILHLCYAERIHDSAAKGNVEEVKMLISKGVNVNEKDDDGYTPLHHAAGNCKLVPVGKNKYGEYYFGPKGHLELVEFLVSKGADVNARDNEGKTPLHYCAIIGNIEVAKFLVSNGVNVNVRDNSGWTPVQLADRFSSIGEYKDYCKELALFLKKEAGRK